LAPWLQNERGISALGVAVGFNRASFVQLLLDAGADLALRDAQGNTVLHYAAGEKGLALQAGGKLLLLAMGLCWQAIAVMLQVAHHQDMRSLRGPASTALCMVVWCTSRT
jgi:hypothetical protein